MCVSWILKFYIIVIIFADPKSKNPIPLAPNAEYAHIKPSLPYQTGFDVNPLDSDTIAQNIANGDAHLPDSENVSHFGIFSIRLGGAFGEHPPFGRSPFL